MNINLEVALLTTKDDKISSLDGLTMNTETELQKKSVDSKPDSFDYGIKLTGFELDHHLRLMAALKMFELGKISSGRAAHRRHEQGRFSGYLWALPHKPL